VLVNLKNNAPFVDRVSSEKPITLDRVTAYCEKKYEADWERDSIDILDDEIEEIDLDEG